MNRKSLVLVLSITFSLLSFNHILAQSRKGNIVEYFGKEKVNEIREGKLYHVFKEGLAITIQNGFQQEINFPRDPIFNRFLTNPLYSPKQKEAFDIDAKGQPLLWRSISVDTANTFNDRRLRSSYVYLTYESKDERVVLFEASGHTMALINGFPHEGDHYDFGYSLVPLKLKKGSNTFVLKVGRFPRIRARLIDPSASQLFTSRDMTLPDLRKEEKDHYWGGIRIVNASEEWVKGSRLTTIWSQSEEEIELFDLPPLSVSKVGFRTPLIDNITSEQVDLKLVLNDRDGKSIASTALQLNVKSKNNHHKRTFLSKIDQSVQYFSVAPSTDLESKNQALFLSVHGASVEATNQARAYKKKDWGTIVAPTNRRPFGFAWEDWGRIDAMEVLAEAKRIYRPNTEKIYLTGHSMGGHGTWYLGATYPDHFAAIAPCAGYPDLLEYRNSFTRRLKSMNDEQLKRFGMTREMIAEMDKPRMVSMIEKMIQRAGNPSRTLSLKRNYLHLGVYILHGEKDNVVPTFIARDMRQNLGGFHNDFTYYEYPGGTHWYGDHSMDWPPIFDFFKARTIPRDTTLNKLEFYTASPGVSAGSHFVTIHQQEEPFEVSNFNFENEGEFSLEFENVALAEINFEDFETIPNIIKVDGQELNTNMNRKLFISKEDGKWTTTTAPSKNEKGPHRNGGFKDAFRNHFVMVYGTGGSKEEQEWNKMKAMFDAETFGYRANGQVEVLRDIDFQASKYADRNIIIYGNKDNCSVWDELLSHSPIQVKSNIILIGDAELRGNEWGAYFVYPRADSETATIGVVSGTGMKGMQATLPNHYLVNGTSFPDLIVFDSSVLRLGIDAIKSTGFFGNDWSVEDGVFEWK